MSKSKKSSRSNKKRTSKGDASRENEVEPNVSAGKVEQNFVEVEMNTQGRSTMSADKHTITRNENNPVLEMGKIELAEDEAVSLGTKVEAVDDGEERLIGQKVEV